MVCYGSDSCPFANEEPSGYYNGVLGSSSPVLVASTVGIIVLILQLQLESLGIILSQVLVLRLLLLLL